MADQVDKLTIETPELIPLEFPLAGIGSRFLAAAFDSLIQFVISLALLVIGLIVYAMLPNPSKTTMIWMAAAGILTTFLFQFGYFVGFEALWNGQTPGKRHQRLRVIKDSGQPISMYDSMSRNLLRIVDSMPAFYGVGILSILLSKENKRLGDFVAGTVVVHEEPLATQAKIGWATKPSGGLSEIDVTQLSEQEFQLIEAFLMRRDQLPADVRAGMAVQIVQRLGSKFEIAEERMKNPETFLEKLASEYRSHGQYQ